MKIMYNMRLMPMCYNHDNLFYLIRSCCCLSKMGLEVFPFGEDHNPLRDLFKHLDQ